MAAASRAGFLLRPRWLLSHVLVLLLIVVLVNLGFWQLRRLDERRDRNAVIEAGMARGPLPIESLGDLDRERFTPVVVEGEWTAPHLRVANRTSSGRPGEWAVSAVRLDGGDEVLVNRGFVPVDEDLEVSDPSGDVRVEGYLVPRDRLDRVARTDLEDAFDAGALPALVQLQSAEPPVPSELTPVPPPELGDGPHLSYAVQWFVFATIAVIGYPLVLRRVVQRRGREPDDPDDLDRELAELLERGG